MSLKRKRNSVSGSSPIAAPASKRKLADPSPEPEEEEDENVGFFIDSVPETEKETKETKVSLYQDPRKEKDKMIEKSLENFLFGKKETIKFSQESQSDESDESESESETETFRQEKYTLKDSEDEEDEEEEEEDDAVLKSKKKVRKAAWTDPEEDIKVHEAGLPRFAANKDSNESYSKSLKKKFASIVGATPTWADLSARKEAQDSDSDDEFLRETTDMLDRKTSYLSKGRIEYRKLKDMNNETHSEGTVIKSAEFHPTAPVGLVAGINGTASLFNIDGKNNPKIQTVNFKDFPIRSAHFSADGREFIASSPQYRHFNVYDMNSGKTTKVHLSDRELDNKGGMGNFVTSPRGDYLALRGRFGHILILCARTKHKLFDLKMNDDVTAMTFSSDGEFLYSHGTAGEVYVWELSSRECLYRFVDEGCLVGTCIAVSRNNRLLATGSNSGVVNVYERVSLNNNTSSNPPPVKTIMNLTTNITDLKFSPTSEILCLSSALKDNAIKLVHTASMTVYENFPSLNFNLKRVNCLDFSKNGGYFSVGNNRGSANLYRLKHYGNY